MRRLTFVLVATCTMFTAAFAGEWLEKQKQHDRERAKYWAERGYDFDPDYMTAGLMDLKVKDIERAKYWAERGYDFDPDYMTAGLMDLKVKDIERAKYWAEQGYDFDPDYMTAGLMDLAVKQGRAKTISEAQGDTKESSLYPPAVAENGDIFGADNDGDGRVEPVHVRGYFRKDGTYVRGHYRARPRR